ncbi:hypothetical protein Cfor_03779 [Coptotermes formosanus]|uniref:CUE domain-containing protein n=1 Tax=Coptotermes formosanus TaxID=36987 RepID=A0A6L2Q5Y8_COPFO|nr:hypothetical protein Cfor_03779 [Coptotermes formosanus]
MSDCPQFLSLFKCDEHRYHGLKFIGERCFFLSFRYQPENRMKNPSYHQKNGTRVYQQHDLTNVRPSPIPGRAVGPPVNPYASPARATETSMTTDTEQSVVKISAMFPTVSDTHIRALLMKHIHAPGIGGFSALQMTPPLGIRDSPRAGSPIPRPGSGASGSYLGSPRVGDVYRRPHSSPKMKLRYLKSVFPKVEETLLLDILSNSDNNVQKATEKLIAMGFEKRDTPPPRLTLRKKEEEQQKLTQEHRAAMPTPPPRMKSAEEKQKMKARLQEKYPDIPERVIIIALESVDFDAERASQILNIMVQEEEKKPTSEPTSVRERYEAHASPQPAVELDTIQGPSPVHKPATGKASEKAEKGQHRRSKGKKDVPKVDYVTWNGPNVDLLGNGGRMSLAKGPNKSLLQGDRSYIAKGPNSDLRKGPMRGLAKGSIYSQLTASTGNESRGK